MCVCVSLYIYVYIYIYICIYIYIHFSNIKGGTPTKKWSGFISEMPFCSHSLCKFFTIRPNSRLINLILHWCKVQSLLKYSNFNVSPIRTFLLKLNTVFEQKYPTTHLLFVTPGLCWLEVSLLYCSVLKSGTIVWNEQVCGSPVSSNFL